MVNNFANRLEILIKENNTKKKNLAREIGLTPGAITNMIKGWSNPSLNTIRAIARYYHVREEWLEHGEFPIMEEENHSSPVKLIPVYATVPAGWPSDCHVAEEPIGYVPFMGNGRNMGALLVDGHSMSPDIKDGEFVVYVEDYNIRPGDRVVALNEFSKPMVKEYAIKDGEPWLVSVNPEYGNHKVNEHYRIIGRVIEVYSKRKIGRG